MLFVVNCDGHMYITFLSFRQTTYILKLRMGSLEKRSQIRQHDPCYGVEPDEVFEREQIERNKVTMKMRLVEIILFDVLINSIFKVEARNCCLA